MISFSLAQTSILCVLRIWVSHIRAHITIWLLISCHLFSLLSFCPGTSVDVMVQVQTATVSIIGLLPLLTHPTKDTTPDCKTALHQPLYTFVQVACQQDNVSLHYSSPEETFSPACGLSCLRKLIWLSRSVVGNWNPSFTI